MSILQSLKKTILKKKDEIEGDEEKLKYYQEAEADNGFLLQVCALEPYHTGAAACDRPTGVNLKPVFERPAKLKYLIEVLNFYFDYKYRSNYYRDGIVISFHMIDRYHYGNYQDKKAIKDAVGKSMNKNYARGLK